MAEAEAAGLGPPARDAQSEATVAAPDAGPPGKTELGGLGEEPAADKGVEIEDAEKEVALEHVDENPPPEGGYGWVIVAIMFIIQFFVIGIANSVGIFTGYFVANATFPGAANTLLSFSATLTQTGMNLYGPLTGNIADRVSYRLVACTGAVLLAAGGVINSFAVYVWTLFVGGIVQGLGFSCLITPAVGLPGQYFRRRLPLAIGIGMSGLGFGGVVITPVSQALLDAVGWQWAMRGISIVGGVVLFGAGLLMKTRLPPRKGSIRIFDPALLRNKTYWRLAVMCFFFPGNYLGTFLFLPQQIQDLGPLAAGISAAVCLAVLNACTGIGQLLSGFAIGRLGIYNVGVISTLCVLLSFIPFYLLAVSRSGPAMLAFCIFNGILGAPFPVLVSNIAAGSFGQANFAVTVGMIFFWWVSISPAACWTDQLNGSPTRRFAPGIFITGPILGAIADSQSTFSADGARLYTNWAPVVAYGGAAEAVVLAMAIWLRVEKAGWAWKRV
ncbi:major facilitator superfamily domain-containing protein [Hyaloraphidium curvatum]|nr:major facilitator superfamily domain-containing protein [Hyaloraphidium curvatum]